MQANHFLNNCLREELMNHGLCGDSVNWDVKIFWIKCMSSGIFSDKRKGESKTRKGRHGSSMQHRDKTKNTTAGEVKLLVQSTPSKSYSPERNSTTCLGSTVECEPFSINGSCISLSTLKALQQLINKLGTNSFSRADKYNELAMSAAELDDVTVLHLLSLSAF